MKVSPEQKFTKICKKGVDNYTQWVYTPIIVNIHEGRKTMRETTRVLKIEAQKDIARIYQHNNSRSERMTESQIEQHRQDKYNHYYQKWTELLKSSETVAQKNCCKNVLDRLHIIR